MHINTNLYFQTNKQNKQTKKQKGWGWSLFYFNHKMIYLSLRKNNLRMKMQYIMGLQGKLD